MATAIKRGAAAKVAGHVAKNVGSRALDAIRGAAGSVVGNATAPLASRVRRIPIQLSIDVAVPVEVAWDEWMTLEWLPEGMHRVEDIECDGDGYLVGRLSGVKIDDYWEAEILDEREDESFAWRSNGASDCTGLVTFHSLADRLTRIEVELDVVPSRLGEAAGLAVHLADRRAERDFRAFKARVEGISPDEYPPLDDEQEADDQEEANE
jgi:uncharacterized membrane protein